MCFWRGVVGSERERAKKARVRRAGPAVLQPCFAASEATSRRQVDTPPPLMLGVSIASIDRPANRPVGPILWIERAGLWVDSRSRAVSSPRSELIETSMQVDDLCVPWIVKILNPI